MIKAVVFDIGGVLAQDVWEHLLLDEERGVISKYSIGKSEAERIGKLLWEAFAHCPETQQNKWQALEKQYWNQFIQYFDGQLPSNVTPNDFIHLTEDFIKPVKEMTPLLERLQSTGVDLAICSNNTEFWFRRQMDKLGLHRFFRPSKVILSCRVGVSKSSPGFEMFHAVTDALKVAKAHCIFIDDRNENIERAKQYGMMGILFIDAQQLDDLLNDMGL